VGADRIGDPAAAGNFAVTFTGLTTAFRALNNTRWIDRTLLP